MKSYNSTLKTLAIALSLCLGATVAFGQSTLAQSVNSMDNRDRDGYQSNEQNVLGGNIGSGSFDAFDLIHRANTNRGRSMGEFQQETDSGIRNAADEFKRQQNERLQNRQPEAVTDPNPQN
ncbi:MAG: hypothetical protein IGR93_02900 [Hydrococcus sp. C42_A2020_068]|uniref:hypothetical protein n=1 Tax=Pleurocapsa sp. PCC 7327 TaxID=118163 RepID=UPI00029FCF23|nr:hypothetical protein [Pleurocapsa sp. PCC 7327]AFY77686.1 hypothetical protein Ple7327_2381 [Pleurocapsa sp. PCC 7327]MBF2019076.1 hypothetical protein [Hydrococcus sp. C42_A2020_068]